MYVRMYVCVCMRIHAQIELQANAEDGTASAPVAEVPYPYVDLRLPFGATAPQDSLMPPPSSVVAHKRKAKMQTVPGLVPSERDDEGCNMLQPSLDAKTIWPRRRTIVACLFFRPRDSFPRGSDG